METRRLIFAITVTIAVFFISMQVFQRILPQAPPPPSATQPAVSGTSPGAASGPTSTTSSAPAYTLSGGSASEPITLGGKDDEPLELIVTPRGAAVKTLYLTSRRADKEHTYRYRANPEKHAGPHALLESVPVGDQPAESFATRRLYIDKAGQRQEYGLDNLNWDVAEQSERRVVFQVRLRAADGSDVLALTKTYELRADNKPLIDMRLEAKNLSRESFSVAFDERGPIGFPEEGRYFPSRRLLIAHRNPDDGTQELVTLRRSELKAAERKIEPSNRSFQLAWTGSANKYFGVFVRPVTETGAAANLIFAVRADVADRSWPDEHSDAFVRLETVSRELTPGASTAFAFEVYAGPKNTGELERVHPAFADRKQVGYVAAQDTDRSCCPCQFAALTTAMIWLLDFIHSIVRNYGIAILVLVLLVRTALHKLSVYQQKSMFRAQDAMARIQPKLEAIKERYPNDRQRQSQEQMKLYSEEGVNPMAPLLSMIPLFIQMPILIALWNALNTDINLRHAPLDGWWIRDLAAPDALIDFQRLWGHGLTIPILSWLPLIGSAFTNIPSLNLLPIIMGVSMWLQQKYMPKPGQEARKEALAKRAAEHKAKPDKPAGLGQMSPEDQLRQQQMMANIMAVMFPLMFYNQPSGLALYWFFTNIFGICESLIIRKQIREEKERLAREGPRKPDPNRKPGLVGGLFKRFTDQMVAWQKQADELSRQEKERASKHEKRK